jgi:hypothetical protein
MTTTTKINTIHDTKINTGGATEPGTITMSVAAATRLLEVLQTCDEFLRTAPPTVRVELADFCLPRPGISSGCLIDAVGLSALLVDALITDQHPNRQQARR